MTTHPPMLRRPALAAVALALTSTLAACTPAAAPTAANPSATVPASTTAAPAPGSPVIAPSTSAAPSTGVTAAPALAPTSQAGTTGTTTSGTKKTSTSTTTKTSSGSVPAGEMTRLSVPKVGFDQRTEALSLAQMGGAIDPPYGDSQHASPPTRVTDLGAKPSTSADDTVYMGCHTSATYGNKAYPCNVLIRSIGRGDTMVATTTNGTITYRVTETRSIPKDKLASDSQTWAYEPNRLVFVICDVVDGKGNGNNWVIYADVVK